MFASLLIANRGEIACRIIRTARRLGIRTIAVYAAADAGALHVALADAAYCIGPSAPQESYLAIPRLLAAARESGAVAVHPGYGFLAENADFAEACTEAGLIFVGPPAAAIRAMGDKAAAKRLMAQAGVPVVPGYHEADQSDARLAEEARRLGCPLLIKAALGGGGRGLRVVTALDGFATALAAARREAVAAFGNGAVILERYLEPARHIEMQIFADRRGHGVHLYERDCSLQRRHQKIVEEAPAPGLDAALRAQLGAAAVAAARTVGYVGAGTVEFVVSGAAFFFIEMNTRLQVEHPVTEMITGTDLVEWQLRVAAGEPLPCTQEALQARGHAVEARLAAEDPARGFLPATGTLARLRLPEATDGLRIETGVRQGDTVTMHYDSLLAKLVAWGEDRTTALRRLGAALAETRIAGVASNRDFLLRLLDHPDFVAGPVDTGFIARHHATLVPPPQPAPRAALAAASLALLYGPMRNGPVRRGKSEAGEPQSPWCVRDGWRLLGEAVSTFRFRDGAAERSLRLTCGPSGALTIAEGETTGTLRAVQPTAEGYAFELDGRRFAASLARLGDIVTIGFAAATHRLAIVDPLASAGPDAGTAGSLVAPMPGRVLEVRVAPGHAVKRGQIMMVLEAMKMEHAITAPMNGTVTAVHCAAGDLIAEGAVLIALAAAMAEPQDGPKEGK